MKKIKGISLLSILFVILIFTISENAAISQDFMLPSCECNTTTDFICLRNFQVSFEGVADLNPGKRFTYIVCNQVGGLPDCGAPGQGGGLSHVNIIIDNFSGENCLIENSQISWMQGQQSDVNLTCENEVQNMDNSCFLSASPIKLLKCDLDGVLDPGNCVEMVIDVANDDVQVGAAIGMVKTGGGRGACSANCLLGPSCEACQDNPNDCMLTIEKVANPAELAVFNFTHTINAGAQPGFPLDPPNISSKTFFLPP